MDDSPNPYQSPGVDHGAGPITTSAKPRMLRYIGSLLVLVVLTAMLAPADGGTWLHRALTIEFTTYLAFLATQLLVLRGKAREWAIEFGPMLCFLTSVILVVLFTVGYECGFLPHPYG